MSFSFILDEYGTMDITGCWLNVWQGSCQVKNNWRKSRCGAKER